MTTIPIVNTLRGLADAIHRRQKRPTPKLRRQWADQIWAACDALDQPVARSSRGRATSKPASGNCIRVKTLSSSAASSHT
jgi:hypothetical protein